MSISNNGTFDITVNGGTATSTDATISGFMQPPSDDEVLLSIMGAI